MAKYSTEMTVKTEDGRVYLQSGVVDTKGMDNAPSDPDQAQEVFAENIATVLQENRFISLDDGNGSIAMLPVRLIDLVTVKVREAKAVEDVESSDSLRI